MYYPEKPNFQKDGVEHRFDSKLHELKFRLSNILEKKRRYNELRRKIRKIRKPFVDKDIELRKVNPGKINRMQMACKSTNSFKYNFDKVPLHSTGKARFNPFYSSGMVVDGDWDKYTKKYEFDRVYKGIKKHFEEKIPWERTEYFNQYKIREKTYQRNGYARKEIEKTERLYKNMKENGFLTRYDRGKLNSDEPPYSKKGQWPITVNIGRNGEFIFNNTAHNRLAISKILGMDEIPVLTVCRHEKWAEDERINYS